MLICIQHQDRSNEQKECYFGQFSIVLQSFERDNILNLKYVEWAMGR